MGISSQWTWTNRRGLPQCMSPTSAFILPLSNDAKAKGKPFEIVSPDIRHVFVSSAEDIKTIGSGSYNMVSLSAAAKQMFQVRHSMQFTEWADERGKNHLAYVTTTRTRLTRQTPLLIPEFRRIIREDLKRTIGRQGNSHGKSKDPLTAFGLY